MGYHIRALARADGPLFDTHFARHCAESGRGDIHFMPFAPGDGGPRGLTFERLVLALDAPDWQRWFAAFHDGEKRIVGHVDLKGDGLRTGLHRCELGIGIERPFRGQGLGRRLMQHAIDFCRQAPSIDWLDLKVFGHNSVARALYRSLGFIEVGTVADRFRIEGTSVDDVLMTLDVGRGTGRE